MKKILLIALSLYGMNVAAQVKIGNNPTSINANSVLELESTNKGVLYPRVALTATANAAPLTAHVAGMVVYNTATANDVIPGLYINDGAKWALIGGSAAAGTSGASVTAVCNGFTGTYTSGIPSSRSYTVTITNNTFAAVTVTPAVGDLVLNPASGLSVSSVSGGGSIASGATSLLTYTLAGSLSAAAGTEITGTFTKLGLNCSRTVTVAASPFSPLPGNITLTAISPYFIGSIYDQDYLPYTTPTVPASFATAQPANGVNEATAIDFQGSLPTAGVIIPIPYTVTTTSVNLPAYSQTINIPASYTQDGISRDVIFSYPAVTLGVGSGTINATLSAVGGTLNVKKLDIQTGFGNDRLGVLLGEFAYATNNSGGGTNFDLRAVAGIPDRNMTDASHVMFYLPVTAADGRVWLNNNLGADYNNTAKAVFNPAQQATSVTDFRAYGSFFQWGRYSDGHELVNWSSSTAGTPVSGMTTTKSASDLPGNALFITTVSSAGNGDWRNPKNDNLWQGETGANNPCPAGFRVPTHGEFVTVLNAYGIPSASSPGATAAASALRIPGAGYRGNNGILLSTGNSPAGFFQTSTANGELANTIYIYNTSANANYRGFAFPVRCIKS